MNKLQLIATTALSSVLLLGLAAPAMAQSGSAPQASNNDDGAIIVTARRSEERLQDVPISITVLSQEAISKRNIVSGSDLGAYVPSLVSNQQFGPEKASFAIRGFTQEGKTSPSVAVYFADVVAPRSFGGTTAGNGAGVGSFMDLQNVQVLKGPQGTLFGRNSTGGAILLVPQKPKDTLGGYIEGSLGSYNLHRVQAALNAPLGSSVRVRAAADWNERDGYLVNHSGVGPGRLANTNYFAARLSIVADLSPDVENYTIASYSKSDTYGTTPTVFGCNRAPGQVGLVGLLQPFACAQADRGVTRGYGHWDVENPDPNPQELVKQWQVINTTTWKASDSLTIKNIVSYAEFKEVADFNLFGDNLVAAGQTLNFGLLGIFVSPLGQPCAPGSANCFPLAFPSTPGQVLPGITLHPGVSGYNSQQSTFTEELQFQGSSSDGRFNWQAGAYVELSKPLGWNTGLTSIFLSCSNVYTFQCTNPILIGSISASNVKTWFNSKAIYAQATYKLTEQLSLTGGLRYTWDRMKDISQNVNAAVSVPGTATLTCQNIVAFNVGGVTGSPVAADSLNSSICGAPKSELHQNSSRPTWLIDLDYKPSDDVLIYANWRRGYRQGTINSNNLGLEIAKPEKVDTFEIGAKTSFRGAVPGYFNVSLFYNNFIDQQLAINSVVAPAFQGKVPNAQPILNAGKSRIWGVEVDASVRPFKGFSLDLGYAYLNTLLQSFTEPALPIYYSSLTPTAKVGDPLALSPKNRITLSGNYTLPLDEKVGKISLGATFIHTDANAAVQSIITPNYLIPAQNMLNLNVDWSSALGSPLDLSFFMTNATNQAMVVAPGGTYQTNGEITGHVNQPRMWGFRLKYHFGE